MNDAVVIGGSGYVGRATRVAFSIDKYYSRTQSNISLEDALKMKYIFICLPTPTVDGLPFTEDIESYVELINKEENDSTIIIRSTVPPGFAKSLGYDNVVSNPEFLSEDTWEKDAKNPWMVVIGGEEKHRERVSGIYRGRYKYMKPLLTDNTTAELIKYSLNTFFATKVMFANQVYDYAQKVGGNYETVKLALESSPWGSKNHFTIWYKNRRGIHGSCLPKDTEAFATLTLSPFFKTILELNKQYE